LDQQHQNNAIIIATEGLTTNLLFESVGSNFNVSRVILEEKISGGTVAKRRVKKLGLFKTLAQIAFIKTLTPFLSSKTRINEIIETHGFKAADIPSEFITQINSVNDSSLIDIIRKDKPSVIFINGTQIFSKSILNQIEVPMINIHVGITPKYRGVHGGYWALYNNDANNFGTTLHLVEEGIDTGRIIDQRTITPDKRDNFKTYPILQFVHGVQLIKDASENIISGKIVTKEPLTKESQLHYHPGFFQYLIKRIVKGIK
jgi:folate-dependent phosphoribosylglycinamide formyltransferase PurN